LSAYLGDGKTVEIVTDPMLFAKTMEYQELKGVENPTPGTFWGKDFLLVDVDKSGPVSIDIPPGTYNGTQLAAAVQNALRDAFGDDKQIQLTDDIDNSFTIDLKVPAGDGKAKGLTNPITVDLHAAAGSIAATADEAKAGLSMDRFLVHAQRLLTDAMNAYIQTDGAIGDDVTAAANELNVSGRMFKKEVGAVIDMSQPMPTASDVISFQHTNPQVSGGAAVTRYLAYSNVESTPEIKAYDVATNAVLANITKDADTGYLKVTIPTAELNGVTDLEVLRFQQNAVMTRHRNLLVKWGLMKSQSGVL
jgi:hypothetical protein